jgi:hypothetical protein
MIEKTILDYLNETLPVPVYMEVPANEEKRFVVIEKTGSGRENHINTAVVAVQSYAESLYAAAELNEQAKAAMDNLIDLDVICRSDLNSDYNFTDTASKRYRYQAVYDLTHY